MELEPITRQEKIIAGKDLEPVTRMEMFLKQYGGGGGGGGSAPKPLTYDYMPEGYPKKSRFTIEWDGNTEGLTAQGSWYKVSDLVVDPSAFASGATLTYADGSTDFMSIDADTGKNLITIEQGMVTFGDGQVMIFTETPEPPLEIGVYFESDEIYDVRKVTGGEVITPMAEEFLPATEKNTTLFYL